MKLKPIRWRDLKNGTILSNTAIGMLCITQMPDDKYKVYVVHLDIEDTADTIPEAKKKGFAIYSNIIMGLFK